MIRLRSWLFTRINGDEGIAVPADRFLELYSHPAANGRSRGAPLSDLFWYWLSPGAHVHQEHLEPGPVYDEVARCTRRILAMPAAVAVSLASESVRSALPSADGSVRLRDWVMPVWAEFYHRVVFQAPAPLTARELIVSNADDVITALKGCGLRHMRRRLRLTSYLEGALEAVPHSLPSLLSAQDQAFYLQGTFFNTAVVQSSEATAHLLMVLARHDPAAQASFLRDEALLDRLLEETLHRFPLFGIAHRITTDDIALSDGHSIPAGSVLCFNYPEFHGAGGDIPFGVAANRPCPAWRLAPVSVKAVVRELLRRHAFATSASHDRPLPNRGPCVVTPVGVSAPRWRLRYVKVRDRWESVWRPVVQLVLGTYMVWRARRLRLCARHFDET
ncbi:cytochrome P450 [Allorhizocola rhizosphaerae]|uniref:cytochrome P450 n=1 Tax=Allorhizocola rhizosphaerae TaxID=1872709 RepID=UPI001B8D03E8|nr:cytochrome P450 [Allorhizocola rhizosphaerae]